MIEIKIVLGIHSLAIKQFGGADGIRDRGSLESALFRPYSTFDGKDLYVKPIDKAAAIVESILINHPFVDGNKRTGYILMRLILRTNGLDLIISENEKYDFTIKVAEGMMNIEEITAWLESHIINLSSQDENEKNLPYSCCNYFDFLQFTKQRSR